MTKAVIKKNIDGNYRGFSFEGHADYAKANEKDMVCASISVLVINTINSILEFTEDSDSIKVDMNANRGIIRCEFDRSLSKESVLLVDSMILGLQSIQKEYGKKYFELKFE